MSVYKIMKEKTRVRWKPKYLEVAGCYSALKKYDKNRVKFKPNLIEIYVTEN